MVLYGDGIRVSVLGDQAGRVDCDKDLAVWLDLVAVRILKVDVQRGVTHRRGGVLLGAVGCLAVLRQRGHAIRRQQIGLLGQLLTGLLVFLAVGGQQHRVQRRIRRDDALGRVDGHGKAVFLIAHGALVGVALRHLHAGGQGGCVSLRLLLCLHTFRGFRRRRGRSLARGGNLRCLRRGAALPGHRAGGHCQGRDGGKDHQHRQHRQNGQPCFLLPMGTGEGRLVRHSIGSHAVHQPFCYIAPNPANGQTRNTILPTSCSSATQPTDVERESTDVARWSPSTKIRPSGT